MQTRIEPPVLVSRMLTFVLAASLVVLGTLGFTLVKMFPLNRAEVFLLTTRPTGDTQVILSELPPEDENLDIYKRMFIREYIKARNEITPDARVMTRKWNSSDGLVRTWSTDAVFSEFMQTEMWTELMMDEVGFDFTCSVEFRDTGGAIREYRNDGMTYAVDFAWFCTNNYGQTDIKDFTIVVRLAYDGDARQKYSVRLDNPLGIRVAEYSIQSGDADPLDALYVNED